MKTNFQTRKAGAPLTFNHRFSNGLDITLVAEWPDKGDVICTESRRPASTPPPAAEYELWRLSCGQIIADASKTDLTYISRGFVLQIRYQRRRR